MTLLTPKQLRELEQAIIAHGKYIRPIPKLGRLSLRSEPAILFSALEKDAGFTRAAHLFKKRKVSQEIADRIRKVLI